MTERRQRRDWAAFVKDLVDGRYAAAEKIVLVMDQLNTHSPASLYEAFDQRWSPSPGQVDKLGSP